ncbi:MAG TPA: hypothetical protein VNB06_10475 [Thermoanaerobaculia bacterium]|nr:hypothetical protein [Thermoanaerobaculia bacterium]
MADRPLEAVVTDPTLRAHARRRRGGALPVLVQVRAATPQVVVENRPFPGRPGSATRRPVRVTVPDATTARADLERLQRVAAELERLAGREPTILRASHAVAVGLAPAALRAAAALDEVEAIVPDRRHRLN